MNMYTLYIYYPLQKNFMLSNVRFGILSGQIKDVTADVVDSLMEKIEPATLMVNSGKNLSAQERDIERAKILREALS